MDAFLGYWKPNAIVLIENELWPNLVIGASRNGIMLALLNGRMSVKSFNNWSGLVVFPLISLMLSKFSLIVPLSTVQAIRFQLLQASPFIINFCGDLKYGNEEFYNTKRDVSNMEDLQVQLARRHVWLAASIHSGEEKVIVGAHEVLKQMHPDIVTIIVPRHPQLGQKIAHDLQKEGVSVALRSRHDTLTPGTSIYVVDTLGELRHFYRLAPIAVIGGSFLSGLTGHNISEATAAGCAVLTGHHVGHFSHMAIAMRRLNPLSVQQVAGQVELEVVLHELLSNAEVLEARRVAAKQAFHALSNGVIENVWNLLHFHVFSKELTKQRLEQQS